MSYWHLELDISLQDQILRVSHGKWLMGLLLAEGLTGWGLGGVLLASQRWLAHGHRMQLPAFITGVRKAVLSSLAMSRFLFSFFRITISFLFLLHLKKADI